MAGFHGSRSQSRALQLRRASEKEHDGALKHHGRRACWQKPHVQAWQFRNDLFEKKSKTLCSAPSQNISPGMQRNRICDDARDLQTNPTDKKDKANHKSNPTAQNVQAPNSPLPNLLRKFATRGCIHGCSGRKPCKDLRDKSGKHSRSLQSTSKALKEPQPLLRQSPRARVARCLIL